MGETAMDCGIKHLQRKIQNKTRLFGNKDTHFIPEILFFRILSLPPHLFTRRKPSAAPVFQIRFRFTPQLCIAVPRTLHIFCTFVRHATERELTERYDEKIPDPAPADRLLVAGRGTGEVPAAQKRTLRTEIIAADSTGELLAQLRNMPNIEIGKGITFRPKNDWFELTMRFRMQNLLALSFDDDFTLTKTEARVKRLRLRFDGYIYSPKLVYSVQLGFTSYDTEPLPGGDMNIVRDAIVYYVPNATWNIGFGQTKIKANRARINSSSALQFVDRSIVNSEFNLDRDFGFFGEYNMRHGEGFNLSAKGSVTLGEGRNWGSSPTGGLAYTGRLELYPLGRFKSKGDVIEGNYEFEERVKILLAGAYSYNHKASRLKGQRGAVMPGDATRNLGSYFVDFILEYRGFAFYTDFMGRSCSDPLFSPETGAFVYNGQGLNVQTSYLFNKKWEIALRNSTLFPDSEVQPLAGYRNWNQTTLGITRYIIGHSLKVQADMSYNTRSRSIDPNYNRWEIRFQLELGL